MDEKKKKSHVGFSLNLEKEGDFAVYKVLESIPSYDRKTSYIKRAVIFYNRNCNDSNNVPIEPIQKTPVAEHQDIEDVKQPKRKKTKKTAEMGNEKQQQKPAMPSQEFQTQQQAEDILTMSNNSDINENISYSDIVDTFFS